MPPVRIRRLSPAVPLPKYQTDGSAGFDLAASTEVVVQPGTIALVPTGLVIQVPHGHFLGIFARSSTPPRLGLVVSNGVGVIDSDYCGATDEIKVQVLNITKQPVTVRPGDRIAQGILVPFVRAEWQETSEDLRDGARGGFGSTGGR